MVKKKVINSGMNMIDENNKKPTKKELIVNLTIYLLATYGLYSLVNNILSYIHK